MTRDGGRPAARSWVADLADNGSIMLPQPLPRAFDLLPGQRSVAADAALVEVLPHLQGTSRKVAWKVLIQRGHAPTLAALVTSFPQASEEFRGFLVQHAADLSAGIRTAITSDSLATRASAIQIITAAQERHSIYLLSEAVRSPCAETRALAAAALHTITARYVERAETVSSSDDSATIAVQADHLADALQHAVQGWEIHAQSSVLEAAVWMHDRLAPTIRQKVQERHTTIVKAIHALFQTTLDPRSAGFAIRALAIPQLGDAAANAIGRARDPLLIRAILGQTSLLDDIEIRKGCLRIRHCWWLQDSMNVLIRLEGREAWHAVRWLAATGIPRERRMQLYRTLLDSGRSELRRAVLKQLVADPGEAATGLLVRLAGRADDDLSAVASREVKRRYPNPAAGARPPADRTGATPEAAARSESTLRELRAGLAAGDPLTRGTTLHRVGELNQIGPMAEQVYRLAHDPEPVVRSLAVALLAELPGPTSERILRMAVEDPDDRVQANAVEALDRLDVADRVRWTEGKLESRASRVRANAIKSLLRTELRQAGESLLDMLQDPSQAHRLSALWVIERLRLHTVLVQIDQMSRLDTDRQVQLRARRILHALGADRMASSWWHGIAAPVSGDDGNEETP